MEKNLKKLKRKKRTETTAIKRQCNIDFGNINWLQHHLSVISL